MWLARACLATFIVVLSGCAIFNPYAKVPPLTTSTGTPSAATLDDALTFLHQARGELNYLASEQAVISGLAGVGTFIGLAGAGVSAVFGGSRDLILIFATAGASSYGISNLVAPPVKQRIYRSGLGALTCVDEAVRPLASTNRILSDQEKILDERIEAVGSAVRSGVSEGQRSRMEELLHRATSVKQLLKLSRAREPATAAAVYVAVARIFNTVNGQIQAATPDPAAIANAASGIVGMAQSHAAQVAPPRPTEPRDSAPSPEARARIAAEDPQLTRALDRLDQATTEIARTLEGAPGLAVPSLTSCVVADQTATPALTTNAPARIEVQHGEPQVFTISGGTLPYHASWVGVIPTALEFVLEHPYNLRIGSKRDVTSTAFKPGQTYSLQVFDNTPGTPKRLSTPLLIITK
jgi:hypothetical protein